jgi:AraC-like DNA-binding protein
MPAKPAHQEMVGLERLRKQAGGNARASSANIRMGAGGEGIERIEAYFPSHGFSLHRHDTYAIGMTLSGVQTFSYRGVQRYCLPGQCHILHPDEVHDGSSAADGGFRYRIAYIDPSLIQRALGGRPLPFVENPVVTLSPAQKLLLSATWDMADPVDALRQTEIVTAIADVLEALSSPRPRKRQPLCLEALFRVRDLLATAPADSRPVKELEGIASLDRWTLARQFRVAFGTSPTRFRTMRQLDEVRRLVKRGESLTDASLEAGFFDQSHMSRMFKQAYGLTPGKWIASLSNIVQDRPTD